MHSTPGKLILLSFIVFLCEIQGKKFKEEDKPKWAKKDIRDYSDADMERLLDQWEVNQPYKHFAQQFRNFNEIYCWKPNINNNPHLPGR